ncbi:MAG: radical SAM/SPASM domain-containing protein [Thermoanaerobaculaceae bacterium]
MPWELVEKVAADLRTNGLTVSWLHEMGDPLLYPRLREAIDLFPGCSVSTNAVALTPAIGQDILGSSLRRIRLCVDTLRPDLYHQIRRGARFDQVVANIRQFLEQARGSQLHIEIQRLITHETHHESVRDFATFFGLDHHANAEVIEKTCEPLDTVEETSWHQAYYGCFQGYPFRWFIVLADGGVTHCCYDAHGQQRIGDMRTQTVQEIVQSEPRSGARRGVPGARLDHAATLRRVLPPSCRQATALRRAGPDRHPAGALHAARPPQALGTPPLQPLTVVA